MLQYLNQKRAQSTLEYAVLLVVIIGALVSIQVYIKRGIQGRLKSSADDIGDQYSDGNTNVVKYVTKSGNEYESFNEGSAVTAMYIPENTTTGVNSIILNTAQEYWGSAG